MMHPNMAAVARKRMAVNTAPAVAHAWSGSISVARELRKLREQEAGLKERRSDFMIMLTTLNLLKYYQNRKEVVHQMLGSYREGVRNFKKKHGTINEEEIREWKFYYPNISAACLQYFIVRKED